MMKKIYGYEKGEILRDFHVLSFLHMMTIAKIDYLHADALFDSIQLGCVLAK